MCPCDLAHRGPHDTSRSKRRLFPCATRVPARSFVRAPRRNSLNFKILKIAVGTLLALREAISKDREAWRNTLLNRGSNRRPDVLVSLARMHECRSRLNEPRGRESQGVLDLD